MASMNGREKQDELEPKADQNAETPTSGKTNEPSPQPSWTGDDRNPTTDEPAEE